MKGQPKAPRIIDALIPILFLIVLLIINIQIFGTDSLSGSNQMVLILSATVAASIAVFRLGIYWATLQDGII